MHGGDRSRINPRQQDRSTTPHDDSARPWWLTTHAWRDFGLYFGCSAVALCVDYATYAFLATRFGLPLQRAAVTGYAVGMILAYALIARFVFPRGWLRDRRKTEAALFALTGALGLTLTYLSMELVVRLFGEHLHTAKLVAVGASFTGVYVVRRLFVFRNARGP
jgi:putative flippase GtrA